ncbi:hypothetical protein GJ496_009934 [Pomphorhynchus laevis]|nr:hypothetical protein GJ496_009934 [Pomphorhynchus laevis]
MNNENTPAVKHQKPSARFWLLVFVAIAGGPVLFGLHLGLLNNSDKAIKQLINTSIHAHYNSYPSTNKVDLWFSVASTAFVVGGILGSLLIGPLSSRLGGRKAMYYVSAFGTIFTIAMMLSEITNSFELLIISRLMMGIHSGIYMRLSPMYITECSPNVFRGTSTIIVAGGVTFGALLASVFALNIVFGQIGYLWLLFGVPLVAICAHVIGLMFCPESPRLLMERNQNADAFKALQQLRNSPISEIQGELDDITSEIKDAVQLESSEEKNLSMLQFLKMKRWRKMIIIATVIMIGQQLCGVNGILFFSKSTFTNSGMTDIAATYGTLGVSAALFLGSLIGTCLIDKTGRRPLLIFSFATMMIATVLLVPFLKLGENRAYSIGAIICNIIFVISFSIGPGGIGWMITPEMFPFEVRGKACTFASGINWICNVLVVALFVPIEKQMGSYVFLILAVFNTFFLIFTILQVKETKGKTPKEIEDLYNN